MCDFCLECYHPECIGVTESVSLLQSMSVFKCPMCISSGKSSPMYEGTTCMVIHSIAIKNNL